MSIHANILEHHKIYEVIKNIQNYVNESDLEAVNHLPYIDFYNRTKDVCAYTKNYLKQINPNLFPHSMLNSKFCFNLFK